MLSLIAHGLGALICLGAGYYLHYKFGSKLAALEAKVKSVV